MSRKDKEAGIISKLQELTDHEIDELQVLVYAMAFKNEKGLKDYKDILDNPQSKKGKHLKEEFRNYIRKYPRD